MNQNSLFDPPDPYTLARGTDPPTSLEAAGSLRAVRITKTRMAILDRLRANPDGLTDEQIAKQLRTMASPSGLRTRRKELVEAGYAADSGRKGVTLSGRRTIIWVAV
jgi:hypothetical protein